MSSLYLLCLMSCSRHVGADLGTFVYTSTDTVTPLSGEAETRAVELEVKFFGFLDGAVSLVTVVGYQQQRVRTPLKVTLNLGFRFTCIYVYTLINKVVESLMKNEEFSFSARCFPPLFISQMDRKILKWQPCSKGLRAQILTKR